MALKGFIRNLKPLELLDEVDLEAVHSGTLAVLEETGLRIEHERALKLLADHGCQVNLEERTVRFPGGLVEECLRKAPSSFTIKARDPKNDLRIGGNNAYFTAAPGMRIVDLETGESRRATRKENADALKILDALDNLHMLVCYTPYFDVEGIPPAMSIPESAVAKIRNSTKVQFEGYSNDSELFTIEMGRVAGTEVFGQCCASPPLTFHTDAIESALRIVEAGLPLWISTGDIFGGSSPATLAGSVVATNAQLIGIVVLAQLVRPGARLVVSDTAYPMNMQTGAPNFGAIEIVLHQAVFYQMWRKYGLPAASGATGFVSSKKVDYQTGYEKGILATAAALCGARIIPLHGALYGELAYHPAQSILDDDVAGMIGRFMEGVEVSHETLAIDLINQVGPIPGYYLNKEHTRKWWKTEQFSPKVADRLTYPEWVRKGKKDALALAKERMEEILATHEPTPLSREQDKELDHILEQARNYYKRKGLM